jgi:hypothetical protein
VIQRSNALIFSALELRNKKFKPKTQSILMMLQKQLSSITAQYTRILGHLGHPNGAIIIFTFSFMASIPRNF